MTDNPTPGGSGHPVSAQPPHDPAAVNAYPAPGYPPGVSVRPTNGVATAGLVLGIFSIFINTLFVPAILAIVFSSVGIRNAGRLERTGQLPVGKGAAITGLVTGIVGVLHSLLWKWVLLFLI